MWLFGHAVARCVCGGDAEAPSARAGGIIGVRMGSRP